MPIAMLYLSAGLSSIFQVLGTGLALLAILKRLQVRGLDKPDSYMALSAALGVCWAALFLTGLVLIGARFGHKAPHVKLVLDALIIAVGLISSFEQVRQIARAIAENAGLVTLGIFGALVGTWAFLLYPHVFDSGQLIWTQQLLDGRIVPPSAMMGYSGLVAPSGRAFSELPVITVAAAFKPFLGLLAACVAYHAVSATGLTNRFLNAALLLVIMLTSEFGLSGLIELGKDSIFGMIFALAFFAALARPDDERSGVELAIYFAAATSTGIISVPYMTAAYVIWLAVSDDPKRLSSTLPPLLIVNLLIVPPALIGFFDSHSVSLVFAAYFVVAAAVIAALRAFPTTPSLAVLSRWRAWFPLSLAAACVALMPVALEMIPWIQPDGTPVVELRPPLDGKTGFFAYMLGNSWNQLPIVLGSLAAFAIGFSRYGRARPAVVAIGAMPFAVIVALLSRVHLRVPLLSGFNVWDLAHDIPQWLAGTLFALMLVVGLNALLMRFSSRRVTALAVSAVAVACATRAFPSLPLDRFHLPLYLNDVGATHDKDLSAVGQIVWKELRGRPILMDDSLSLTANYFYRISMYDARPVHLNLADLDRFAETEAIGVAVANRDVNRIVQWAAAHKASVERKIGLEEDNSASFLVIRFNGKDERDLSGAESQIEIKSGAFPVENGGAGRFRWAGSDVDLMAAVPSAGRACLSIRLFSANYKPSDKEAVRLAWNGGAATIDLHGSTMSAPTTAQLDVTPNNGLAEVHMTAEFSDFTFPNDARRIAYGIKLPVELDAGRACQVR